jgi:hypothetical protein
VILVLSIIFSSESFAFPRFRLDARQWKIE